MSEARGTALRNGLLRFASVGGVLVLSRIAFAVKDIVVARRFGTSDAIDAFMASTILPLFFLQSVGRVIGNSLVPVFLRLREAGQRDDSHRLLATVLQWSVLLTGVFCVVLLPIAPLVTRLFASGFAPEKAQASAEMLRGLLPVMIFGIAAAVLNAALVAVGRSVAVSALQVLTPGLTLTLLLVLPVADTRVLVWTTVGGQVIEAALSLFLLQGAGIQLARPWPQLTPPMREIMSQFLPLVAAQLMSVGSVLVDQAMSAALSPGAISSLNFGTKPTVAGISVCNLTIGMLLFPRFSQLAAKRDWAALRRSYVGHSLAVMAFGCAVTLVAVGFAEPIVSLLYERGAFTHADALRAAEIQRYFALQIPFHLTGVVGVQMLLALGRSRDITATAGLNLAVNIAGNWILSRYMGVAGIALSTSVVMLGSFLTVSMLVRRALREAERPA